MKLCPKCQKQFSDDANFCPVDAARLLPLEGQTAGVDSLSARFELGEQLGGSRTGTVHRAKDKQGGAAVAVKLVAPAVTALPGVAQRLERELKQLERVQSAGVAKIVASGKRGEQTWIALELIEGAQTLAESISSRGPITLDQAAHLIEVIGEALIEAAQVGVVHRDLAPKNVLFAGGEIKLINFSLPVPTTDKVPGVPEFVAPEQVDGKPVDQRSNLYNLGALYYYVLTGQTVHAGSVEEIHRAHAAGSIRTPSSLAPVPAPVEAMIMRALDRSPTKRFLTVRQFVDEVTRIARGDGGTTQQMGKAARPKAELVQTLLGVRGGLGAAGGPPMMPSGPSPQLPAQAPSAPGLPGLSPVAVAPAPMVGTSTVVGFSGGLPVEPAPPHPQPQSAMQAPPMQAPVAVAAPSSVAMPDPSRSPWAPPAAAAQPMPQPYVPPQPMAGAQAAIQAAAPEIAKVAPPVVAAPVVAAPVVAAPVLAAPVVAAPQVAQQAAAAPAGKRKPAGEDASKGKFRETMWFKKGDLDAQAAVAAADERAKTGKDASADKADSLPIDERYKDDGSISRGDKEKYSLRTGATQMMSAIPDERRADQSLNKVSEDALIGEMKGGRGKVIAAIAVGIVLLILIIVLVVS
ncbi:MAG: serine/threonine protein kinase [Myxococcales bacterium]|nr:serine/threonine protein kinase [Myxococcales bacterium]